MESVNEEVRAQIQEMIALLSSPECTGVGLAAPQVGILQRFFITWIDDTEKARPLSSEKIRVYINPVLSQPSSELSEEEEGCLSIPGVYGQVQRPEHIVVRALDLQGAEFWEELSGFEARVLMHENDHLNGTLFPDRMKEKERKSIQSALTALKKREKNRSRGIRTPDLLLPKQSR